MSKKPSPKKDLVAEQAKLKKQLQDTMKSVEQFEKELSFLTKPEIIDLATHKSLAPPAPSQRKQDLKNPWGNNTSSLIKGIKANTLVLNHKEAEEVDTEVLQVTLQKSYDKELTINRVMVAQSSTVMVEMAK